ncbi:MAG: hypothetical protein HYX24_05050 [Candidatus Aenigmarchaeota archaeon]|nr:hypothetical protein [Candidatus Aenigmarchaeota archaeon]
MAYDPSTLRELEMELLRGNRTNDLRRYLELAEHYEETLWNIVFDGSDFDRRNVAEGYLRVLYQQRARNSPEYAETEELRKPLMEEGYFKGAYFRAGKKRGRDIVNEAIEKLSHLLDGVKISPEAWKEIIEEPCP